MISITIKGSYWVHCWVCLEFDHIIQFEFLEIEFNSMFIKGISTLYFDKLDEQFHILPNLRVSRYIQRTSTRLVGKWLERSCLERLHNSTPFILNWLASTPLMFNSPTSQLTNWQTCWGVQFLGSKRCKIRKLVFLRLYNEWQFPSELKIKIKHKKRIVYKCLCHLQSDSGR